MPFAPFVHGIAAIEMNAEQTSADRSYLAKHLRRHAGREHHGVLPCSLRIRRTDFEGIVVGGTPGREHPWTGTIQLAPKRVLAA